MADPADDEFTVVQFGWTDSDPSAPGEALAGLVPVDEFVGGALTAEEEQLVELLDIATDQATGPREYLTDEYLSELSRLVAAGLSQRFHAEGGGVDAECHFSRNPDGEAFLLMLAGGRGVALACQRPTYSFAPDGSSVREHAEHISMYFVEYAQPLPR